MRLHVSVHLENPGEKPTIEIYSLEDFPGLRVLAFEALGNRVGIFITSDQLAILADLIQKHSQTCELGSKHNKADLV